MQLNFIKNLLSSSKKTFYISIIIISVISALVFLINLKSNNRKFNQNLINSAFTLYTNKLLMNNNSMIYDYDNSNTLINSKNQYPDNIHKK